MKFYIFLVQNQLIIMGKGYLGEHPQLFKKSKQQPQRSTTPLNLSEMQSMTQEFIQQQRRLIQQLQIRITAYRYKINEQESINIDHSDTIESLQDEIRIARSEEGEILDKIQNCRLVEDKVTPMEYYLWKKKQRLNAYDMALADLCKEVEQKREYLERSIDDHRKLHEQLLIEIDELEDRIANFTVSPRESIPAEVQEQEFGELFAQNITLKQEYTAIASSNSLLEENRQIAGMQVIDSIDSIASTLKSFFEDEKTKIIRQFKQMQVESKTLQISPVTKEELNYSIEPLLGDYNHKMAELLTNAPEEVKKIVQPILQPLPWKNFHWLQYLQTDQSSEKIYDEYTSLQKQVIVNQKQSESLQSQLRRINSEIANEHHRYDQICMNISKLKKRLEK